MQKDEQTDRNADIQADRYADIQAGRNADIQAYRYADIQADRHADIQPDRPRNQPRGRQVGCTDRFKRQNKKDFGVKRLTRFALLTYQKFIQLETIIFLSDFLCSYL